ncbi:N-acetylneuraminate synthase family protein [Erythrobacter aurantius]|uniref:N-acetylneuraminate synthase family protein n=1 Tax=Erythrobacter aurantius TaxID=2909249 RepID=UPI00207A7B6A|nr:N-acetylneuraminate synthase family protein [Erythrobacter aurantius]
MSQPDHAIAIGRRSLSDRDPCFIIAEIGVNHDGDLEIAHKMIDAAKASGADAVKFQTFKTEANILRDAPKADYQKRQTGDGSQFDMVRRLELQFADFVELKRHCDAIGIEFLTTAFDPEALDFVVSLSPACLKWPSGEINNLALLRQAARSRLPVLVSTGMASLGEVDRALDELRGSCDFAVMQCVSDYPARLEDQNLRVLRTFAAAFHCPVGLSDHTLGQTAAIAARALGMAVLEKHFTLDAAMPGPDHAASMEPHDFRTMVDTLRALETGLGDGIKRPVEAELSTRAVARKSLVYARDLAEGHLLTADDLCAKRPGTGLPADLIDQLCGQTLARAVSADTQVRLSDMGGEAA